MIYHFFIFGEMHLPFTVKGSCAGKFCFNGGFCDGSSSTYKCLCRLGFSGINCSESRLTMYYRMHVFKVLWMFFNPLYITLYNPLYIVKIGHGNIQETVLPSNKLVNICCIYITVKTDFVYIYILHRQ